MVCRAFGELFSCGDDDDDDGTGEGKDESYILLLKHDGMYMSSPQQLTLFASVVLRREDVRSLITRSHFSKMIKNHNIINIIIEYQC